MIEREDRDGVLVLRLAHGKASALDLELLEALSAAVDDVSSSDARALVLTGTGTIFSAGVDLFRLLDEGEGYVKKFLPALTDAIVRLFALELPVVAAANGHAIAGGCVLVSTADYRLMSRGAGRIGIPELHVGVPFPAAALEAVRFATPRERLQEIIYTGRTYLPEEAREVGLVDEVVEPDALLERAVGVARSLADLPPSAFAITKRQLRQSARMRIRDNQAATGDEVFAIWSDPETHTRIRDYLDRTIKSQNRAR